MENERTIFAKQIVIAAVTAHYHPTEILEALVRTLCTFSRVFGVKDIDILQGVSTCFERIEEMDEMEGKL